MTSTAKAPARKDIRADFPLRGFIDCNDCETALTACWSTSKTGKKHPYYLCKTKGCESYRKSIRRDQLEKDFEELLQTLEPSKGLFQAAKAMFRDIWGARLARSDEATKTLKSDLKKIEGQIETMLDRIVESNTGSGWRLMRSVSASWKHRRF